MQCFERHYKQQYLNFDATGYVNNRKLLSKGQKTRRKRNTRLASLNMDAIKKLDTNSLFRVYNLP